MLRTIELYFLLFFTYSVLGWIMEVTKTLIDKKKFVNRGFLIGPYCPIYGYGVILLTILLKRYQSDIPATFIFSILICGTLEYFTSYFMEKIFHARWWDYSKRKFNIDGRVCLGTTIPFGLFGLFLTYVSNPFIISKLNNIDPKVLNILAIVLLVIYIIDNIVSTVVIMGFRKTAVQVGKEGREDNTEQITKKVREILSNRSWMSKRLVNAYPKLTAIKYRIKEIKQEVKENAKEIKENLNDKAREVKNTIKEKRDELQK